MELGQGWSENTATLATLPSEFEEELAAEERRWTEALSGKTGSLYSKGKEVCDWKD